MIRVVETGSILEESHARAHRNTGRGVPEVRPARAGEEDGRGDAQRPSGRGGGRPRGRRAIRAHRRPRGLSRGPLRAEARDDVRRGDDPHAQAQGDAVHRGDHRALPAPRGERRGGHDRDVSGGGVHQADRGRERDALGPRRLGRHRLEPEREGLRGRRGAAQRAARARPPLRLRRRHLPEAQLGRQLRERRRDGRHRRQRRRLPRDHRRRRGVHGVGRI